MLKGSYLSVNPGTNCSNSSLYLSNQIIHQSLPNLVRHLKSFIMRKTILLVTSVVALMVTSAQAEHTSEEKNALTTLEIGEINSFCKAIVKGELETVKKLISLGEDVNRKSLGKTPAMFAARYNRAEILKVLIANGANLNQKCDRGFSVKKYAELSNAHDALSVIEEALES